MLRDPSDREQRERIVIQRKYWLLMKEVELHASADDRGAEQGQEQEQPIEPPALVRWPDDPDLGPGLLFPFEGGRKSGCRFRHRPEVRGLRSDCRGVGLLLQSDLCNPRTANQSIAVPCRA